MKNPAEVRAALRQIMEEMEPLIERLSDEQQEIFSGRLPMVGVAQEISRLRDSARCVAMMSSEPKSLAELMGEAA